MAGQCGRAVGANKNWAFIAGGRVDVTLPAFFFFFWNAAVPMRRSGNKNTPNFVPHFLQTILLFDTTWINEAAWPTIKEQVCVFYKKKKKKTRPTALFSLCALLKQWIKLRGGGYIDSCLLQPFSLRCCQWQHFVVFFLGNKKPRDCNAIPREPSQTAFTFACKSVFETDSRVNGGKARGGHLNRRQEEF